MYIRNFPRSETGKNSASKSKGTVNPPTPKPTTTLKNSNHSKEGAVPDKKPHTTIKLLAIKNAFLRPYLSAIGPQNNPPSNSPPKTTPVIDARCRFDSPHSLPGRN